MACKVRDGRLGFGNLYLPSLDPDKALKGQRMWNVGRVLAVFEGRVYEDEVRARLASTGFLEGVDRMILVPCDRNGLEFQVEID